MDKKTVLSMLQENVTRIQKEAEDIEKFVKDYEEETKSYISTLLMQITSTGPTPLLAKTPKVPKKKATRIKTIPENDEVENDSSLSNVSSRPSKMDTVVLETSDIRPIRSKRGASVKAADIIKKQQSVTLNTKLRRPSDNDEPLAIRVAKESRSKRPKEEDLASSDEENIRPSKQSKIEKKKNHAKNKINDETTDVINETVQDSRINETMETTRTKRTSVKRKLEDQDEINKTLTEQSIKQNASADEPAAKKANYSNSSNKKNEKDSKFMTTLDRISEKTTPASASEEKDVRRVTRSASSVINAPKRFKENNIVNETVDMSNADETIASMYEDAVGKPIPIMNSTMNPNSIEKMINVTVLLEPLSAKKIFNETVTIQKNSFKEPLVQNNSTLKEVNEKSNNINDITKTISSSKETSKNQAVSTLKVQKQNSKIDNFNELITDDESSPERKEYRMKKEKVVVNQQKRVTRSSQSTASDEDEVLQTPKTKIPPPKNYKPSTIKAAYKQAPLFSPYAKDSVKKRVEAFEQVAVSPKQPEAEREGGRVTRTKTRALAAASFSDTPVQTVSQKLARKSLAKAKKISLAKQAKEHDETKENDNGNYRTSKLSSAKTTPLGKSRMHQMPSSVTKTLYATPSNSHNLNVYSKPMTGSRGNIVTHVDSFIQPMKSASKPIDRAAEEKRRRANEEDARRKREELLKARAEEKRRKREEKELKNKLAREAKEKLEYEKRLKAEKEREEKAKLAQQLQEKQKEEMEKKRIAQMQRAQEKEEKRRQEEMLRLQRLQEQEEQERELAEQRRREQEMEKRKQAEMKHMAEMKLKSQAEMKHIAEMKLKSQMDKALLQAKAKVALPKQVPTSYKIDSEPDEEDSDDESKPKHQIPHWALKHVRQTQLAMQKHIPMKLVLRYFDAKKCTPDLRDLFKGIDPKRLKRSSSAIWKTPPRYSMMNRSMTQN